MSRPDDDVQAWFDDLSFKAKKQLALAIKEQADGLAEKIKAAAPVRTGALRDSVMVRRKKNDLDLEVIAGGDLTTKEVRGGSGVSYDYSRAIEFGSRNHPAEPFFFNTYRANKDEIDQAIQDAVEEAINS